MKFKNTQKWPYIFQKILSLESATDAKIVKNFYCQIYVSKWQKYINPVVPNAPFLYPLKASENRKVFWCFQGVEKGWIGNKRVKHIEGEKNPKWLWFFHTFRNFTKSIFSENFKSSGQPLQKLRARGVSKNGQNRPKHGFGPIFHTDMSLEGFSTR